MNVFSKNTEQDWEKIRRNLKEKFRFNLNLNQWREIQRLTHEISRRENMAPREIIAYLESFPGIHDVNPGLRFKAIKKILIERRFPLSGKNQCLDMERVFLPELKTEIVPRNALPPGGNFVPEKIYLEKQAKKSYLAGRFAEMFPKAKVIELDSHKQHLREQKYSVKDLKNKIVFIVNEKWDFIKPCPCTPLHLRCNYWIFNLGFGCPFDCSYCYLQQYSNLSGLVLPANLEDFFDRFDSFHKKIGRPIRIGTGEFCDSLALDHITKYSEKLVNFFRGKNLFFELKTKSDNVGHLLSLPPSENIVVSFSLNPGRLSSEEQGCASLAERLSAAKKVRDRGFSLAFHFDPVIYYPGWENDYRETINQLYSAVRPGFRWLSLGTLRANRELKTIVERRFPRSDIFYGELFLGEDKKLRYPEFMRISIYKKMLGMIREYDTKTPLYLCMENKAVWNKSRFGLSCSNQIERHLLGDLPSAAI